MPQPDLEFPRGPEDPSSSPAARELWTQLGLGPRARGGAPQERPGTAPLLANSECKHSSPRPALGSNRPRPCPQVPQSQSPHLGQGIRHPQAEQGAGGGRPPSGARHSDPQFQGPAWESGSRLRTPVLAGASVLATKWWTLDPGVDIREGPWGLPLSGPPFPLLEALSMQQSKWGDRGTSHRACSSRAGVEEGGVSCPPRPPAPPGRSWMARPQEGGQDASRRPFGSRPPQQQHLPSAWHPSALRQPPKGPARGGVPSISWEEGWGLGDPLSSHLQGPPALWQDPAPRPSQLVSPGRIAWPRVRAQGPGIPPPAPSNPAPRPSTGLRCPAPLCTRRQSQSPCCPVLAPYLTPGSLLQPPGPQGPYTSQPLRPASSLSSKSQP